MAELIVGGLAKLFPALAGSKVALGIANLGVSLLLSSLAGAFGPRQQEPEEQAAFPNSQPVKRAVYGLGALSTGIPAPNWIFKSDVRYSAHIVNMRPSQSISGLLLNKTAITLDGDPFDFTGPGAVAVHGRMGGKARFWFGMGDQSGPPALFMSEFGDATATNRGRWWPTDRFTGLTVIFGKYTGGPISRRRDVWADFPPLVQAIGNWSLVWDPRDLDQDPDDSSTWAASDNAWLCILDALRFNPIARLDLDEIDVASFAAAATHADGAVALKAGGTEPRHRLGGAVDYTPGAWVIETILPMVAATGGDLAISGGRIRAVTMQARSPALVLTNRLTDSPLTFTRTDAAKGPRGVRASWPQPQAAYEMQAVPPRAVPGQVLTGGDDRIEDLPLPLVPSGTQAQRLAETRARVLAQRQRLRLTVGPEVFANGIEAGDVITVALPGHDFLNGEYQLVSADAAQGMQGDGSVALRQDIELAQWSNTLEVWTPATDEDDIYIPPAPTPPATLPAPGVTLAAVQGSIEITIAPPTDFQITGHEFQVSTDAGDSWDTGNTTAATGGETPMGDPRPVVTVFAAPPVPHLVRVRATGPGRVSPWTVAGPVTPLELIFDAGDY